jgi:hypothetical protein
MTFLLSTAAPRLRVLPTLAVALTLVAGARTSEAQVGYLPDKSPYEDIKPGQLLSLNVGQLFVKRDPAKVAPEASPFLSMRYDLPIGGPASMFTRYTVAPSTRRVLNPELPLVSRVVGTPNVTTHVFDIGIDVSLTGRKTWRHLMPSLAAGIGVASDFAGADTGTYRFGTKFAFSYGAAVRYLLRSGWAVRVDATNNIWQYQYPDKYFVKASDTTSVLTNTKSRSAWRGNWALSAGLSMPIFR